MTPETTVVHVSVQVRDFLLLGKDGGFRDLAGLRAEDDITLRWVAGRWLATPSRAIP